MEKREEEVDPAASIYRKMRELKFTLEVLEVQIFAIKSGKHAVELMRDTNDPAVVKFLVEEEESLKKLDHLRNKLLQRHKEGEKLIKDGRAKGLII